MKYKRIGSAIHNFGASFLGPMNYFDGFVMDDIGQIQACGHDMQIDWLKNEFDPSSLVTERIGQSMNHYHDKLADHLTGMNVDIECLVSLQLVLPKAGSPFIEAMAKGNTSGTKRN